MDFTISHCHRWCQWDRERDRSLVLSGGGSVIIADINEAAAQATIAEFGPVVDFVHMNLGDHEGRETICKVFTNLNLNAWIF